MAIKNWKPSPFVTEDVAQAAIHNIVPVWLRKLTVDIINSARAYQPRFGSAKRTFLGITQDLNSTIEVKGPMVEFEAFDTKFKVPVGGFKYGDIDPKTGRPFPGGTNRRGTYVTLEDKPEFAGEEVKYVSRTYTKLSGQTIKSEGFMSKAIRDNIGYGIFLSDLGRKNFQILALALGIDIAGRIAENVVALARTHGYTASTDGPTVITIVR